MIARLFALPFLVAFALPATGCDDPVKDAEVAKLGPEKPGVPQGPLHRGGQPCLTCHDGTGPARAVFVIGGTAYQLYQHETPLVGSTVGLTDATGSSFSVESNCAGNFFVREGDWTPTYPVYTTLYYGNFTPQSMLTHIGRDGSCADCHTGHTTPSTLDFIYLTGDNTQPFSPSGCP